MFICKNIVLALFCGSMQLVFADSVKPKFPEAPADIRDVIEMTPEELMARGQYEAAVNKIVKMLKETPGNEKERAVLLSNLGMTYNKLGRYADAENTLQKALRTWKALGLVETDSYVRTVNNLANVFLNQERYAKAEEAFKEALAFFRRGSTENVADVALVLSNLGLTHTWQHHFGEAERLLQESLEVQRTNHLSKHVAFTLNNLAFTYKLQGRLEDAARLYVQAVEAWESNVSSGRPEVAVGLHNLAMVESALGQNSEAERHFKQALAIVDATLPPEHPTRTAILSGYADLLKRLGRKREAKQFQALARSMRAQHDHENFQDLTVNVQQISRETPPGISRSLIPQGNQR